MSDTPRTDEMFETEDVPSNDDYAWRVFARQLERELNEANAKIKMLEQMERFQSISDARQYDGVEELRKDKARLDWLLKTAHIFVDGHCVDCREILDHAMEAKQS